MSQHVRVNGIDFGYFYVEGFGGLLNDKINTADCDFAGRNHMGDFMNGGVKDFSEGVRKVIDQSLAAAGF